MSIFGLAAGVIGAIGSIVKSLAVVELAIRGLKAVIGLLVNVAKSLGLIEEPNPELAEKALQAEEDEGITPDDFDTYEEFKEDRPRKAAYRNRAPSEGGRAVGEIHRRNVARNES